MASKPPWWAPCTFFFFNSFCFPMFSCTAPICSPGKPCRDRPARCIAKGDMNWSCYCLNQSCENTQGQATIPWCTHHFNQYQYRIWYYRTYKQDQPRKFLEMSIKIMIALVHQRNSEATHDASVLRWTPWQLDGISFQMFQCTFCGSLQESTVNHSRPFYVQVDRCLLSSNTVI